MTVRIASLASILAISAVACSSDRTPPLDAPVPPRPAVTVLSRFDVAGGELPEGLVIADGVPYVGMAPTSRIARVDPSTGAWAEHGTLPAVAAGTGFMTGLAIRPGDPGALYAALASFTPDVRPGLYRVGPGGGAATLFAAHRDMAFPNGVAAESDGALYVTDSAVGAVFRVSPDGKDIVRWAESPLLAGDDATSCARAAGHGVGFTIGANGIVQHRGDWYVANSDRGTIVRIRVGNGGVAGALEVFAGPDCDTLGGIDGIASDGEHLIAAMNYQHEVARVDHAGRVTPIAAGGDLDFPASPAVAGDALYVTAFAYGTVLAGGGAPALVRIDGAIAR